jgi:hypothetical protein
MTDPQLGVPLVGARPQQPYSDEKPLPPLRLHHLLVMIAVSSVLLAGAGPGLRSVANNDVFGRSWITIAVPALIHALIVAFAITVSAFGVFWRLRGIPFPRYPGHWLLVAVAASYVFSTLLGLLVGIFSDYAPWSVWLTQFPGAILDFCIGFWQCVERRWRWVFYLKAIAAMLPILGDLPLMVVISRASLGDRRMGVKRDALHRSGVAAQLVMCILMLSIFFFVISVFALRL